MKKLNNLMVFEEYNENYDSFKEYSKEDIEKAMNDIENMDHYTMCKLWRFAPNGSEIYFRNDLPTGEAFRDRLFGHFGGFTPGISKSLGW